MEPNEINLIFDLDDTLLDTRPVYAEAERKFVEYMQSIFVLDRDLIQGLLESIDKINLVTLGLSSERFPDSMRKTYRVLTEMFDVSFDIDVAQECERIGEKVFNQDIPYIQHAEQTINTLARMGFNLYIYTGGDREIQWDKIKKLSFLNKFKQIYIIDTEIRHFHLGWKTLETSAENKLYVHVMHGRKSDHKILKSVLERNGMNIENTWMIGNSAKSDINPALACGTQAIWFNANSWFDDVAELINPSYKEITSLVEIKSYLIAHYHKIWWDKIISGDIEE